MNAKKLLQYMHMKLAIPWLNDKHGVHIIYLEIEMDHTEIPLI